MGGWIRGLVLAAFLWAISPVIAQSVEVGGELAQDGLRPYLLVQWAYDLGGRAYLIPTLFLYPFSLEDTLHRGFLSLQLIREGPLGAVGVEAMLREWHPAFRFFLRFGF